MAEVVGTLCSVTLCYTNSSGECKEVIEDPVGWGKIHHSWQEDTTTLV